MVLAKVEVAWQWVTAHKILNVLVGCIHSLPVHICLRLDADCPVLRRLVRDASHIQEEVLAYAHVCSHLARPAIVLDLVIQAAVEVRVDDRRLQSEEVGRARVRCPLTRKVLSSVVVRTPLGDLALLWAVVESKCVDRWLGRDRSCVTNILFFRIILRRIFELELDCGRNVDQLVVVRQRADMLRLDPVDTHEVGEALCPALRRCGGRSAIWRRRGARHGQGWKVSPGVGQEHLLSPIKNERHAGKESLEWENSLNVRRSLLFYSIQLPQLTILFLNSSGSPTIQAILLFLNISVGE